MNEEELRELVDSGRRAAHRRRAIAAAVMTLLGAIEIGAGIVVLTFPVPSRVLGLLPLALGAAFAVWGSCDLRQEMRRRG